MLGLAIAAFLIIGFILLAYARGYRWDFETNRPLATGGVYLKTLTPADAEISINAKPTNQTTAALIKNLLPLRKYQAQVAKTGYQPWQKEFEVTPGLVTEAENIILFPEKLSLQTLRSEPALTDFSVSPNQELMAVKMDTAKIVIRDLDNPNATATPLAFADKIKTKNIELPKNNQGWSANSRKFIFSRVAALQTSWYIWDAPTQKLTNLTLLYERKIVVKQPSTLPLPTKFTPAKILWFVDDNNLLILLEGKVFQLNIAEETVTDLALSDVIDFDAYGNKIIALKNPDILLLMDSAVENVSLLGQTKFRPQRVLISPDGAKVAYTDNNTLGVMWLKDTTEQPLKKSGDQETIYESSDSISDLYWHSQSEHLIFLENQNLKVVELDARDQVNLALWPETVSVINYLSKDSKLYLLEDSAIKLAEGEF